MIVVPPVLYSYYIDEIFKMEGDFLSELLTVESLCKNYNTKPVLQDISLSIQKGELFSLAGPSGAGKTTFLKILSGIEYPDSGKVIFNNKHAGSTIMVFQEYLLFPHMTVSQNLIFGLKARKLLDRKERKKKTAEYLSYFRLSDKSESYPEHLSGGQRQRVALARAMIIGPELLLLDEPFANLDKNLKGETAKFIRQTVKDFGITAVLVTHDLEEASLISDRLGIFLNGRLRQTGTVQELYQHPSDLETAAFLGPVNHIPDDILPYIDSAAVPVSGKDIYSRAQGLEVVKDSEGPGIIKAIEHRGSYMSLSVIIAGSNIVIHSFKNGFVQGDRVKIILHSFFTNRG